MKSPTSILVITKRILFPSTIGQRGLGRGVYVLLFLVTTYCQLATAQLHPVQANPNLVPPYSLKLSDYATTTAEKLKLMLLMTDVNEGNLQVRLRMSIEGDRVSVRSTDFVQGAMPIHLVGGVPTRLSNLDLRPYFELRNLQGINPRQYNTPLPDGLYRFCFEVFDFVTGRRLSQKRCIPVYLVLNDPPFLNLPQRGEQIAAADPQNLIFQWTPRHLNATGVRYEFQLRELWDGGIDPQAAFLSSPDLYKTTTFATTLHYGPGETALLEGRKYGWRVRALVTDGISETSVFKNDGYSEIFHFTYTGKCDAPRFVLAMSEGTTSEKIIWQTDPGHVGYQVQFRKSASDGGGRGDRIWFESETTETEKMLRFLEPSTEYEFRVGGQCIEGGGYSFSAVNTFTTPSREEASTYNCGIPPEIFITNQDPLEALSEGDSFTAGDFPVRVTEATGGNGTFSGKGVIEVPYLGLIKIGVRFDNISINTDGQMTDGTVETEYDADFATGENAGSLTADAVRDAAVEVAEKAVEVAELAGDVTQLIKESLDLDISRDTKEKINKVADAMMENMNDADLPEELVDQAEAAATKIKESKESYDSAVANGDTKAAETAQKEFKSAQDDLADTEKDIDKYKKEVADLLKEAITELYREGRDNSAQIVEQYSEILQESVAVNDDIIEFGSAVIEDGEVNSDQLSQESKSIFQIERTYGIYLFSKVLSEKNDDALFSKFLEKSKEAGSSYSEIIKKGKSEDLPKGEIIALLEDELRKVFIKILL